MEFLYYQLDPLNLCLITQMVCGMIMRLSAGAISPDREETGIFARSNKR